MSRRATSLPGSPTSDKVTVREILVLKERGSVDREVMFVVAQKSSRVITPVDMASRVRLSGGTLQTARRCWERFDAFEIDIAAAASAHNEMARLEL